MDKIDYGLAREGDSEAFKRLFKQYQPVVFKMQKKYFVKDLERDDWSQEGQIIFFQSLQGYDCSKGVTFGCFFKINFERHIVSLLRKQGALKRKTALVSVSFEKQLQNKGERILYWEKISGYSFTQSIVIQDLLSDFSEGLSQFENNVFRLYLKGNDCLGISRLFNCRESRVQNALERIKQKFKQTIY